MYLQTKQTSRYVNNVNIKIAQKELTEYCTCKKPSAPSRIGSLTAHISAVPSSHCSTLRLNHKLAMTPNATAAYTSIKTRHVMDRKGHRTRTMAPRIVPYVLSSDVECRVRYAYATRFPPAEEEDGKIEIDSPPKAEEEALESEREPEPIVMLSMEGILL